MPDRAEREKKLAVKQQKFLEIREKYEAAREKRMQAERVLEIAGQEFWRKV